MTQWYRQYLHTLDSMLIFCFFFFQAEDGIRDVAVTGVQTCALPIWRALVIPYSSPRRRGRRVAGFFLQSGQGETAPSVLAAGGVAPEGTIQSSTLSSGIHPPSTTTSLPASIPRVLTR